MTRHAFILPEQEMTVFWAPKAACSTVAEAVAYSVLDPATIDAWDFDTGGPRALMEAQGMMTSGADAFKISKQLSYETHAILRDPYDRLISAFVNKFIRKNEKLIRHFSDMEPFAFRFLHNNAMRLGITPRPEYGGEWKGVSFRRFVNVICDIIDESEENNRLLNQHWNTQVPEPFLKSGFEFDHVYDLSTVDKFFDLLFRKSGKRIEIPKRNASHYDPDETGNLCDVGCLEIGEIARFSKSCFEDAELRARVSQSFSIDYTYLQKAA